MQEAKKVKKMLMVLVLAMSLVIFLSSSTYSKDWKDMSIDERRDLILHDGTSHQVNEEALKESKEYWEYWELSTKSQDIRYGVDKGLSVLPAEERGNVKYKYVYFRKEVTLTNYTGDENLFTIKSGKCLQIDVREVFQNGKSSGYLPIGYDLSTYNSATKMSETPKVVIGESCQEAIDKTKKMDAEDKKELEKRQQQLAKERKEKQQRDAKFKSFPPDIQQSIREKKVQIGMSAEQVVLSWGRPNQINRSVGAWGVHEQ